MLNRRCFVDVVRLWLVTATTTVVVLTKMIGEFFEPQGEDKLKLSVHHFLFDQNLNHPCHHQVSTQPLLFETEQGVSSSSSGSASWRCR